MSAHRDAQSPPPLPSAGASTQRHKTAGRKRLPPPGKKFPCRKCGAKLTFDPSARALKCPYCGFEEQIKPSAREVEEQDWDDFWDRWQSEELIDGEQASDVTCNACGAVVLIHDRVATDKCPYCAAHLENVPAAARRMIPVKGVLPFAIARREAIESFNAWISGLWFAPGELKKLANLGQLTGMYLPFWTYDSMTYTHYIGERGDNYTVTETYTDMETFTETDSQGQSVTRTRPVTKTREVVKVDWTDVSGDVDQFFDDVLVCASESLPQNLIRELEPWDLTNLEEFRPDYLSGFMAERYTIGLRDGFKQAKSIMDSEVRDLCCRDIGGDHQRLHRVRTQHVGITFKHLLLPVWVAAFRYKDVPYQILVNAHTGEVVGTRPYNFIKILKTIAVVVLLILGAFAGFVLISHL